MGQAVPNLGKRSLQWHFAIASTSAATTENAGQSTNRAALADNGWDAPLRYRVDPLR
jgi:hypothetical protein